MKEDGQTSTFDFDGSIDDVVADKLGLKGERDLTLFSMSKIE